MSNRRYWLSGLALLGMMSAANACGPDFPTQLLSDRAGTLKTYPANSFAYEASHLAPAVDKLKPVETEYYSYDTERAAADWLGTLTKAEAEGLAESQIKLLGQMRETASGDAAYELGKGIPEQVRLYTAGAVDFRVGQWADAGKRFRAILDLPESDRRMRSVWAAFMLGRAAVKTGDVAAASAAFVLTRRFVVDGAADPLGLAVASFGEEAKLHFDNAKNAAGNIQQSPDTLGTYQKEIGEAVGLYAQQAATGSNSGIQSLRMIAEMIMADPIQLSAAVADRTTERLLVAFALARVDDIFEFPPRSATGDGEAARPMRKLNPILPALIAAIQRSGVDHPDGADRLAELAYRCGQYDLAEKMAGLVPGPLSDWIRAKIALQKGDLSAAAAFYSSASKAFGTIPGDAPIEPENAALMIGESGVLALARGEYVAALDHLFDVGDTYWGDVAHIAERVLTVDELKAFVDRRVPPVDLTKLNGEHVEGLYGSVTDNAATRLRRLTARRLMREGRYEDALPYFPRQRLVQSYDRSADKVVTSLEADPAADAAVDYMKALRDAKSGWTDVSRARGLYRAAGIARQSGMEILGYEEAPDFAVEDGAYDGGYGPDQLNGPFITEDEKRRFGASAAKPDKRFHYRYIAADEASRAADLLPPRSQAFAAVLCNGSSWLIDRYPPVAQGLYRRYLKEGPHVPWANHFARACPEPDFDSAATLKWHMAWWDTRHFAGRNRWALGATIGVFALLAGGLVLRSRWVVH
jgi:cellulose synthase operon protein C